MSSVIHAAIKLSNERFLLHVWPAVKHMVGGGDIVPVEAVTNPRFAEDMLDKFGSIDLWHILPEKGKMRGMASRVQKLRSGIFQTFTLRDNGPRSEYERLATSIDGHFLHPELFCQAYLMPGYAADALAYAAMVRVRDLIKFFQTNSGWRFDKNTEDGKAFRIAAVSDLQNCGVEVKQTKLPSGVLVL
jgi:hypothetical protein